MGLGGEPTSADALWDRRRSRGHRGAPARVADERLDAREAEVGEDDWAQVERIVLLRTIDSLWVEHLTEIDDMRRGIGLRGYAQQDPLNEFRREAFRMYEELRGLIRHGVASTIFRVTVQKQPPPDAALASRSPGAPRRWPAPTTATARRAAAARWAGRAGATTGPGVGGRLGRRSATAGSRPIRGTSESSVGTSLSPGGDRRGSGRPVGRRPGYTPDGGPDRPERPMLVRLGRQVQEVPRPLIG